MRALLPILISLTLSWTSMPASGQEFEGCLRQIERFSAGCVCEGDAFLPSAVAVPGKGTRKGVRPVPPPAQVSTVRVVSDNASWQKLLTRAQERPTRTQTTKIGQTTYKIFIVQSQAPLVGQDCPEGTSPQNTLFVTKPIEGTGKDIYPVRISAVCMGPSAARDTFSLNAGWDGAILDAAIFNGSLGVVIHAVDEPVTPAAVPAEPASFESFLARLVKHFVEAP